MTAEPESWSTAYEGVKRLARGVAEDDLQDAALAALRTESEVKQKRGWLRAVARTGRKVRTRRAAIWNRVRMQVPPPPPDEADPAERAELIEILERALAELPEAIGEAVRLRFFEELTTREIAQRQGCPHGTARWRLHDGLRRLRRTLDDTHGGREAWLSGVVALAGLTPPPASHVLKAALMISSTALLAIALLTLTTHDDAPPTSHASVSQTASVETTRASVRPSTSSAEADISIVDRPSAPAPVAAAPKASPTAQATDDDGEVCGDEAIRAFNTEPDDPDAEESLFDAATCYQDAGLFGRAYRVFSVMLQRYPEGRHADTAKTRRKEIMTAIVDAKVGLATPLGKTCMAPVEEATASDTPTERLAAADCLMGGGFVGAALEQRQLAAPRLDADDREANTKAIAKLETMLAAYRKKLESTLDG